jgi:hypothetical protein
MSIAINDIANPIKLFLKNQFKIHETYLINSIELKLSLILKKKI